MVNELDLVRAEFDPLARRLFVDYPLGIPTLGCPSLGNFKTEACHCVSTTYVCIPREPAMYRLAVALDHTEDQHKLMQ